MKKSLEEILRSSNQQTVIDNSNEYEPGDRDDNLWITFNYYKIPQTQSEWESACFLNKVFHGYYTWPKFIEYYMNKRERYTPDKMPEHVSILYDHFIDKNFVKRLTQCLIFDEDNEKILFNIKRFQMYKVIIANNNDGVVPFKSKELIII